MFDGRMTVEMHYVAMFATFPASNANRFDIV